MLYQQIYSIFVDLQTFASKNITSPKPPIHHFPQKLLGNREAGGVAYYGVDVAVGAFGCRFFVGDVVRDFGRREDLAATEAAAKLRLLQLLLVAEAAIVSLAKGYLFLQTSIVIRPFILYLLHVLVFVVDKDRAHFTKAGSVIIVQTLTLMIKCKESGYLYFSNR